MSEEVNISQLLDKGDEIIQKLIDTGARSWSLSVPARPNEDPDLVLSKIISEFRKERQVLADTKAQLEALEDAIYDKKYSTSMLGKSHDIIDQAIQNSRARKQG